MNDRVNEELLSAYFDGELSAKERIQVERWLTGNSDVKQRVADYRRLSRMFEGLSRTEVPQEFATEVLQCAERRMLLPEASVVPRARPFRVWWLAIPATAAAALMLAINLANRHPEPGQRELVMPERGVARVSVPRLGDSAGRGEANDSPQAEFSVFPDRHSPRTALAGPLTASAGSADNTVPETENAISNRPVATTESPQLAAERIAAAAVDEALLGAQAADANGKSLSVVTIYVDGAAGLTLLQKVFEDQRIVPASTRQVEESVDSKEQPLRGATRTSAVGQALCVVVTEPEQLVGAFARMIESRHSSARIDVQDPILVADLDSDSRSRVIEAEQEVSQTAARIAEQSSKGATGSDQAAAVPDGALDEGGKSAPIAEALQADVKRSVAGMATPARRGPTGTGLRRFKKWDRSDTEIERSARVRPPADNLRNAEVAEEVDDSPDLESLSRQVVVAIPSILQSRVRDEKSRHRRASIARRASGVQRPEASDDMPGDENSDASDKSANRPSELVRMLIIVEYNPAAVLGEEPGEK